MAEEVAAAILTDFAIYLENKVGIIISFPTEGKNVRPFGGLGRGVLALKEEKEVR